ncbi:Ykof family thiamine-binding protein [Lentilactobacillus sp. IMAU92037]|uniref:Ykof family thiamine-binding protein n=1 Tax=Lentilactobacillus TaxID=2767893 RepID=UPI001C2BD31E|nr:MULTISPECIES: Ykof family thiamine-binding protein [Lentilactobacillus]MBV0930972.1 Ykof family thiamine-binding protein [Lentilactobacillus dabitei]MDM7515895.1 Ykof family thiamine-binding protein [Lentilactobacillus sp. TOM.63]
MNIDCNIDGSVDVTGCKLSVYPMSDQFATIITDAIKQLNSLELPVWQKTDMFSTTYRGRQENVVNIVKAACQLTYTDSTHTVYELTFSKGCPGDTDADHYLNEEITPIKLGKALPNMHVDCKYSFYAFGDADYMKDIEKIVNMAEVKGLNPEGMHYATKLSGSVNDLFDYFNEALSYAHEHIRHYVMEVTISVNSPSVSSN